MPEFPYVGFSPYGKSDASRLHGRSGELALLADTYTEQAEDKGKMLVIYGPSGVGKTSFVQAGLWPLARRSRDVARLLRFEPGPGEDLPAFVQRIRGEVGRIASDPQRRPLVFIDEIDQVVGYALEGHLEPGREASLRSLLEFLSQAALRGIARVVLALREPWSHTLELAPATEAFARNRTEFFRLDFLSPAGLEQVLHFPFARWLEAHPLKGVTGTTLMETYFSELTLHPAALPLFSALTCRAHDLRTLPPSLGIGEFAIDHAARVFESWPAERQAKLPVFVELFDAAASARSSPGPVAAPMRVLAADPDAREITGHLIHERLLTLSGSRWETAQVRLSHAHWLRDCPWTGRSLGPP